MSTTTASSAISQLPREIWEHVADYIIDPRDLLRLALVNSSMRDIVIPLHLSYSRIVTYINNEQLWNTFTPRQAGRIRELWMISQIPIEWCIDRDCFDPWRPNVISSSPKLDDHCCEYENSVFGIQRPPPSILFLDDNLAKIHGHRCLIRDDGPALQLPPWIFSLSAHASMMTGLLKLVLALRICDFECLRLGCVFENFDPHVKDLEIRVFGCAYHSWQLEPERIWGLELAECITKWRGQYERFSWHSRFHERNTIILNPFIDFLSASCPTLRELELSLMGSALATGYSSYSTQSPCALETLWDSNWPLLHTLSLRGVEVSEEHEWRVPCFFATVKLQVFRATAGQIRCSYSLPALRDLHVLEVDGDSLNLVPKLLNDMHHGAPLHSLLLHANFAGSATFANPAVDAICLHGTKTGTLRSVTYRISNQRHYIGVFHHTPHPSHVYWLRTIGQFNPQIIELNTLAGLICKDKREFEELLLAFPNLESLHFRNDARMDWLWYDDRNFVSDAIPIFQQLCPKLRRVERYVKEAGDVWRNMCEKR